MNGTYSLLPPFTRESTSNWLLRNATLSKPDSIVLTPHESSKWGSIWNQHPTKSNSWKAVLRYSVFGKFQPIADGIAFWLLPVNSQWTYAANHHVYGGPNRDFTGLLIAIDNYQLPSNLTLNRTSDESAVIVVYNKEARHYNWITEGQDIMSGRCLVRNRYRNTTNTFAKLAVEYVDEELKVYHTNGTEKLQLCVAIRSIQIPTGYLLGISAGNGLFIGAFEVQSFMYYEDKRCGCKENILWIVIYVISALLIVAFIAITALACYKCQKDQPKNIVPQRPTPSPQKRRRRENKPKQLLPPRVVERDSTNYIDMHEQELNTYHGYDHLKFVS